MHFLTFGPAGSKYPVILLSKTLQANDLKDFVAGIEADTIAYALPYSEKKLNKAQILAYFSQLMPICAHLHTDYLIVTDGEFFKAATGAKRVDRIGGYVLPCTIPNYEHIHAVYAPSPATVIRDPVQKQKVNQMLSALASHRAGTYQPPGTDVVKFAEYPHTVPEIASWLQRLLDTELSCDIETYDLKHYRAGIGTMTLCWSEHEGIAFSVDKDRPPAEAKEIRKLLRTFFEARSAKTLYHPASFDVYVLIFQLFMEHILDTEGMLYGIEVMLRNVEDTKLIRYLATNTCAGNKLDLKSSSQEFIGNYAVDVKDIRKVPLSVLLPYNLYDGLATWYVYKKHMPDVVRDQQQLIYDHLFKPVLKDIIQMQLTGLPLDMEEVKRGKVIMEGDRDTAVQAIMLTPEVAELNILIAEAWAEKRNNELKVKRVTPADCPDSFNINSNQQLQRLLHEVMGLPVLNTTDSGQPATGMDDIEELIGHVQHESHRALLNHLIDYKKVEKILTAFIPAFEDACKGPDGWHYLFGNYNLGGTLSGRLSSSDPNLQNLPATGSKYAKLIKKMFKAPPGKLFVGLDFNSLEDMISALTTKDPNKLKVYTDGFDGHCLRAAYYFRAQLPHINLEDAESVNSLKKSHPHLRQESKAPTFALTYQGTWRTLVNNGGFTPENAKEIEKRYHEMYHVSDKWVQDRLAMAAKTGYVTVAFGLRLRTPMMAQTIMGLRSTPYEAEAEGRTAGNAMGQSYCMLNSRAAMAFMRKVRLSPYRLRIRLCAQIHDAMYFLVDNDIEVIHWLNEHLVQEVRWQELPEIQHPTVKLGGEVSIFYPTWAQECVIPNGADRDTILQRAKEHIEANG